MQRKGIDLDIIKFYGMNESEIEKEIQKLKSLGIYSISIIYDIFINETFNDFREMLLKSISKYDLQITLQSKPINELYTTYIDDDQYNKSIQVHKEILEKIKKEITKYKINDNIIINFIAGDYSKSNKDIQLEKSIYFFNEITSYAEKLNFAIVTEIVSKRHFNGTIICNNWDDVEVLCKSIKNKHWGINWNTGNTRINVIENEDDFIPKKEIMDRVKIMSIHNEINSYANSPLYKGELQIEEIKAMINNNYKGIYNLEYVYSNLKDKNINYDKVYDSIEYLGYILSYFKNQYKTGKLEINYDITKMNREYIRKSINSNIHVKLIKDVKDDEEKRLDDSLTFDNMELSIYSIKLTNDKNLKLEEMEDYNLYADYKDKPLKLRVQVLFLRENKDVKEYVFKILNTDKGSIKKLYDLVYLD